MTTKQAGSPRQRGSIRRRGDTFQVRAYAGHDPETGKRRYLTETCRTPAEAEAARVRLVAQVDCGKGRADKLGFGDAVRLRYLSTSVSQVFRSCS